jgi:hypothetical protein
MSSGAGQLTPEQIRYIVPDERVLKALGNIDGGVLAYSEITPDPYLREHKFTFRGIDITFMIYPCDGGHMPNFNVKFVSGWSRTLLFANDGELDLLSEVDSVTYGAFVNFLRGLLLLCKFNPQ